jgi:hypothetical protein
MVDTGRTRLPADAVCKAYTQTSPGYWEPVFFSPSRNFTGTEDEFYEAGHAYQYVKMKGGGETHHFKWPL